MSEFFKCVIGFSVHGHADTLVLSLGFVVLAVDDNEDDEVKSI